MVCFGPTERMLGRRRRTAGRLDDAVVHLERAVEDGRRLGNRPMLALARADLGTTLLAQGADVARGRRWSTTAASALEDMGLHRRAARIREDRPRRRARPAAAGHGVFRFAGGTWEVTAGDERAVVADSLGMRHLARLLAAPGHEFRADELGGTAVDTGRQDVLDERALGEYRRRILELRADLDEAEADADIGRADKLRAELDQLVEHIETQVGLGRRSRTFADPRERARTAVRKAIRRAVDRIAAGAPDLGRGLERSVHTGLSCRFEPADGVPAVWDVTAPL